MPFVAHDQGVIDVRYFQKNCWVDFLRLQVRAIEGAQQSTLPIRFEKPKTSLKRPNSTKEEQSVVFLGGSGQRNKRAPFFSLSTTP